jgi:hypothetical protein
MKRSTIIGALSAFMLFYGGSFAVSFEGWDIATSSTGDVSAMSIDNPKTELNIENTLRIDFNIDGKVTGGHVRFKNGMEREMNQIESLTYFDMLGGSKAQWDYYESQQKLKTLSANETLSQTWVGKDVRLVSQSGKDVIGTLVNVESKNGAYAIKRENAIGGLLYFWMNSVSKLQIKL